MLQAIRIILQGSQTNEWFEIAKVATPIFGIIVVILGFVITHYFNSKRDRENKIRELRLVYLIETYRKFLDVWFLIENFEEKNKNDLYDKVKSISYDVQLFGTKAQIEKWFNVVGEITPQTPVILKDLLKEFRDTVRKELYFDEVKEELSIYRQPKKKTVEKIIKIND